MSETSDNSIFKYNNFSLSLMSKSSLYKNGKTRRIYLYYNNTQNPLILKLPDKMKIPYTPNVYEKEVKDKNGVAHKTENKYLTLNFNNSIQKHLNCKKIFKKVDKHFLDIVNDIEGNTFDSKKVSLQAVHNELISNPAFVLIGRGIYALKAWGYKDGTVSDVLESVLAKMGPLNLKDLTSEVLKLRKVKPITIQINLSSKKHKFRKNKEGLYELV